MQNSEVASVAGEVEKTSAKVSSFLLPSLLGVFLFMTPIPYNDTITIPVAVLAKLFTAGIGDWAKWLTTALICSSALMSSYVMLAKPTWLAKSPLLTALFKLTPGWYAVRMAGAALVLAVAFGWGPEIVRSGDTGGLILFDLMPTLLGVFLFAGMLLPLLLYFGLLELVGTLMSTIMRPLFTLPGRGAIDSLASWLGDGSVGIMLTTKQYEDGHYTQREGVVMATTFSTVSITFSLVVLAQVRLEHMFLQFYAAVCVAGFAAAVITPRIPPLSLFRDSYINGKQRRGDEDLIPQGHTTLSWGWYQALQQAQRASKPGMVLQQGLKNVADLWIGVLPVIMAVGTTALVIAETTPLFTWLGMPFIPVLELLRVPEAAKASETLMVGFADMFVPSILAASIETEMTRFIIAAVSVTQLIYLSEVGALILGSKLPVKLWQLFIIFLMRTMVTLPVIAMMAHLFF